MRVMRSCAIILCAIHTAVMCVIKAQAPTYEESAMSGISHTYTQAIRT